jgi:hypothetical protein
MSLPEAQMIFLYILEQKDSPACCATASRSGQWHGAPHISIATTLGTGGRLTKIAFIVRGIRGWLVTNITGQAYLAYGRVIVNRTVHQDHAKNQQVARLEIGT